jgi:hypothetical protein
LRARSERRVAQRERRSSLALADRNATFLVRQARVRYHDDVVTRKYPLDLLQRARAAKVETTSRALSVAQRRVASAEGEIERRMQAKANLEHSVAATSEAELGHLEKGELIAADLERAAAWRVAADMQRASHARLVEEASSALARAREEAEHKQRTLANSQRDAELVEKHHERWRFTQQREATAKDEETAEEAFLARSSSEAHR